jgi:hypothetical protein
MQVFCVVLMSAFSSFLSSFYKVNLRVDSTGRMVPNWEPPHLLDKVLRQIRMNESEKSIDQE